MEDAAEFEISIPAKLYSFFTLPLVMRLLLILYGISLVSFGIWFIWFINGAN